MRIFKKFLRILAIFLPCLVGVLLFTDNSYAVSDYTYTFNHDNYQDLVYFCYNNEPSVGRNCSDYRYLKFENNFSYPSLSYNNAQFSMIVTGSQGFVLYHRIQIYSPVYYDLSSMSNYGLTTVMYNSSLDNEWDLPSGWSVTVTLTDHLGSGGPSGSLSITENGTYDVTSYATAVVDVPAEVLPGDYDDEFDGVITAIYICGASAIMIYFFYIIYGIFIKPTGGQK